VRRRAAYTVITANETLNRTEERDREADAEQHVDDARRPAQAAERREVRALIAYLRHPNQTPILATADNAKDFFNGKDLTGWEGDPKLWSVENGEIVGKSPGIKRTSS